MSHGHMSHGHMVIIKLCPHVPQLLSNSFWAREYCKNKMIWDQSFNKQTVISSSISGFLVNSIMFLEY